MDMNVAERSPIELLRTFLKRDSGVYIDCSFNANPIMPDETGQVIRFALKVDFDIGSLGRICPDINLESEQLLVSIRRFDAMYCPGGRLHSVVQDAYGIVYLDVYIIRGFHEGLPIGTHGPNGFKELFIRPQKRGPHVYAMSKEGLKQKFCN